MADRNLRQRNFGRADSFEERRKQADLVTKLATILAVVSWGIIIAAFLLIDAASPVQENLLTRLFAQEAVRDVWDIVFIRVTIIMLVVSFIVCVAAFLFNKMRMRRKTDHYKISIIISGIINFVAIIALIITFWADLFVL
ncbi:MAG: hypothetical protein FWG68_05895 [Defluviitaleaceae bacterium]|nr:hypothetical protein [Defluviitaleaceae bacterium]